MDVIGRRALAALTTFPDSASWAETAALFLILTLTALPFGRRQGFLQRGNVPLSLPAKARVVAFVFLSPALLEEFIFRVLLLPHPSEHSAPSLTLFWSGLSLLVFVAYHPIKARLFPVLRKTPFANPAFLFLAALVGAACTVAYLRSGSIWPPTVLHGLSVSAWLLWLGGWEKMNKASAEKL